MSMLASEIKEWLDTLDPTDEVFINDDGMALEVVGVDKKYEEAPYLEIGGYTPEDEEDGK